MSFTFNWPRFSDQFHYDAIQMLNTALNKGNKPPIIADKIEVVELEMGTQPPELEIRDIGDLTVDQFRGIFRLTYAGDAHLVLKTKVQANPLNHKQPDIHQLSGSRGMLAAKQPLVVPMLLRLSHFRLSSYVVLVISKQKGITLVFKTDPLQNVDINSTFDSIAVIQSFIQREIEGQLRQMFREDLPSIIHRLSQQWVKAKVESPYQKQNQIFLKRPPPVPLPMHQLSKPQSYAGNLETRSSPDLSAPFNRSESDYHSPPFQRHPSLAFNRHPRSTTGSSLSDRPLNFATSPLSAPPITNTHSNSSTTTITKNRTNSSSPNEQPMSFPDLENFDPTYGLRPEGLPTKSVFKGFSSLFTQNKGLVDLAEESLVAQSTIGRESEDQDSSSSSVIESEDDDAAEDSVEGNSYDFVDWAGGGTGDGGGYTNQSEPSVEYETIPAVGGGTITRPRIYHTQSQIHPPGVHNPSSVFPQASMTNGGSGSHSPGSGSGGAGGALPPRPGNTTPGVLSRNSSNPYFSEDLPHHLCTSHHIGTTNTRGGSLNGINDVAQADHHRRVGPSPSSSSLSPHFPPAPTSCPSILSEARRPYPFPYQSESGNDKVDRHPPDEGQAYPRLYINERKGYDFQDEYDESYGGYDDERREYYFQRQHDYLQQSQHSHYPHHSNPSQYEQGLQSGLLHAPTRPPFVRRLSVSSSTTTRTATSSSSPFSRPHSHRHNPPSSLPSSSSLSLNASMTQSSSDNNYSHSSSTNPCAGLYSDPTKIILRPSLLNNSIHHLSTLSHSYHTLSPYTRSLEHFAVRSGPPRGVGAGDGINSGVAGLGGSGGRGIVGSGNGKGKMGVNGGEVVVKARRKRIFRIGGAARRHPPVSEQAVDNGDEDKKERLRQVQKGMNRGAGKGKRRLSFAMTDFDKEDMDRYFRSLQDEDG